LLCCLIMTLVNKMKNRQINVKLNRKRFFLYVNSLEITYNVGVKLVFCFISRGKEIYNPQLDYTRLSMMTMDKLLIFLIFFGIIYFAIVSLIRQHFFFNYSKGLYPIYALITISVIIAIISGITSESGRSAFLRLTVYLIMIMVVICSYMVCWGVVRIIEKFENKKK
jgi:hypothetical protein